jgi:membrane-associated protein
MELLTDIFTWATGLIDSLAEFVSDSPLTYVLIFVLVAVDVVLPILPAEAIVTAAAVLAGQGQLNIVWVMIAAALGAFVGDNIGYWIGRAAGRPLVERLMRGNTEQLESVERQFQKRGGTFIIVGRFIPGGRTVVAIGAGVVHFSWVQFMIYDAIAAVIWSFQAALPGYIGGVLVADKPWLALLIGFGMSIVVASGMALFQRWREGRRDDDEGPDDKAPGDETGTEDVVQTEPVTG